MRAPADPYVAQERETTPFDEQLRALGELVKEGKARTPESSLRNQVSGIEIAESNTSRIKVNTGTETQGTRIEKRAAFGDETGPPLEEGRNETRSAEERCMPSLPFVSFALRATHALPQLAVGAVCGREQ